MSKKKMGLLVMAYGTPYKEEDLERYYTHIRHGRAPSSELLEDLRCEPIVGEVVEVDRRLCAACAGIPSGNSARQYQRRKTSGPGDHALILALHLCPCTFDVAPLPCFLTLDL